MTVIARRKGDWPQLGEAMNALPNNRWRNFVEFLLLEKPGHGAQTNAARRAGFGRVNTSPLTMARISTRLMHDPRIQAAIAEESRKMLRAGAPDAVKAVNAGIRNPEHKDHAKFVAMVLDRTDPTESRQFAAGGAQECGSRSGSAGGVARGTPARRTAREIARTLWGERPRSARTVGGPREGQARE
jgi:hypothetical protein